MRTRALAAIALGLAAAAAAQDLTVLADRVLAPEPLAAGPRAIVIRGGRIVSVDPGAATASGPTLDARGQVVVPGLVDLRSGAGLPASPNEEAVEVSPSLHALDFVDPASPELERARAAGITTVAVAPGGRAVIGGLVAVLKTDDRPLRERVLSREAALFLTLGVEPPMGNRLARFQRPSGLYFRRPGNRMGGVAEVRRAFHLASVGEGDPRDVATLRDAAAGRLPVFVRARVEADILTALRLGDEIGFRPVLHDGVEAHRCPEAIAAAGMPVVLGPFHATPRQPAEWWEGQDVRHATPKILHDAGVTVAIGTGPDDPPDGLRDAASVAWRHGLPPEAALAAITSVPAGLLGVATEVGRIAPGLSGDLAVLDGDPLAPTSRVLAVVIEGRIVLRSPELGVTP